MLKKNAYILLKSENNLATDITKLKQSYDFATCNFGTGITTGL